MSATLKDKAEGLGLQGLLEFQWLFGHCLESWHPQVFIIPRDSHMKKKESWFGNEMRLSGSCVESLVPVQQFYFVAWGIEEGSGSLRASFSRLYIVHNPFLSLLPFCHKVITSQVFLLPGCPAHVHGAKQAHSEPSETMSQNKFSFNCLSNIFITVILEYLIQIISSLYQVYISEIHKPVYVDKLKNQGKEYFQKCSLDYKIKPRQIRYLT